jgi:hypothetical protein
MDTNRLFTNLFGGWLTAADKAAAATISFTRSNLRPCISDLIQKTTLATGEALLTAGYKLIDVVPAKDRIRF